MSPTVKLRIGDFYPMLLWKQTLKAFWATSLIEFVQPRPALPEFLGATRA